MDTPDISGFREKCLSLYNNQIKPYIALGLEIAADTRVKVNTFLDEQLRTEGSAVRKISGLYEFSKQYFNEYWAYGQPYTTYGTAVIGGSCVGFAVSQLKKKGLTSITAWSKMALGAGAYLTLEYNPNEHTARAVQVFVLSFIASGVYSLNLPNSKPVPETRWGRLHRATALGPYKN